MEFLERRSSDRWWHQQLPNARRLRGPRRVIYRHLPNAVVCFRAAMCFFKRCQTPKRYRRDRQVSARINMGKRHKPRQYTRNTISGKLMNAIKTKITVHSKARRNTSTIRICIKQYFVHVKIYSYTFNRLDSKFQIPEFFAINILDRVECLLKSII